MSLPPPSKGPIQAKKFQGFPEMKEAFMARKIDAANLLAPLAMELRSQGVPLKIVALGHRSGSVVMVRSDSAIREFRDLRGKVVAVPSRFATQRLLLWKLMKEAGMGWNDFQLVEMNPPDMPAALAARAIDAYATGEPFGAAAEMAGYGRVLVMTRDKWPNYFCCVLAVREEFLRDHRPIVQQLVTEVLAAGRWLDASMNNRLMAAEMAAGPDYFNQKPELIKFVLSHPMDRVTYTELVPRRDEFDEMMRLALEAGVLERPVSAQEYVDDSLAKAALEAEQRAGGSAAPDPMRRIGPDLPDGKKKDAAKMKGGAR